MRTFAKRNTVYSVGNQIGTGKESGKAFCFVDRKGWREGMLILDVGICTDIYVVADQDGNQKVCKIHRYASPASLVAPI
jgi:RIO kinase 2